ncbi:glutamate cyclase domain-containing protein [Chloroflexota bacterium]
MDIISHYIDRLITVEVKPRGGFVRGIISQLYDSALKLHGGRPLTLLAAEKLIEHVSEGDNVIIITGVGSLPFFPHGETDGPLGAACLARAISLGLDAKPLFMVGERDLDPVKATVIAAGLNVEEYDLARQARSMTAMITCPTDDGEAKVVAKKVIKEYSPKAVISIETLGPNNKGFFHNAMGYDMTTTLPKLQHVFNEARSSGILTLGILDHGNELGSGGIEDAVRKVAPYGNICQCPCGAGNACCVPADITLPASMSNWGAYGVAAALACLLKNPDILHDVDIERRMLEANVAAGGRDGVTLRPIMQVDGVPASTSQAIATILNAIVLNGLKESGIKRDKGF